MDVAVRILLDLSTSFQWRGQHAVGIVRTEREIARRLLNDETLDVLAVVMHDGVFYAIDPSQALSLIDVVPTKSGAMPEGTGSAPGEGRPPKRSISKRVLLSFGAVARAFGRFAIRCTPEIAREPMRQILLNVRELLRALAYGGRALAAPSIPGASKPEDPYRIDLNFVVHPRPSDFLLIGGLGWDVINCQRLALIKKKSGMRVASISFDFIPTKFPEFLGGEPNDYFKNYFLHMADLSDHIFCISKTTQSDLWEFCNKEGRNPPRSSVIYLGANLPAASKSDEIDPPLLRLLKTHSFALAVGTFEIRKNYALLLDVWERLAETDPDFDLPLVIAGMPGWGANHVIERLEASPLFGSKIFWVKRLSDSGISWLYDNCRVFLFPSFYEGWGLPVVEALQHGKPAIVSDRGSVPEASLGVAKIINIDDIAAWCDAVRSYALPGSASEVQGSPIPTWDDTAHDVKTVLVGR